MEFTSAKIGAQCKTSISLRGASYLEKKWMCRKSILQGLFYTNQFLVAFKVLPNFLKEEIMIFFKKRTTCFLSPQHVYCL